MAAQRTVAEVAVVVNQDAGKAARQMVTLRKMTRKHKVKLVMSDGADLDYTIRKALEDKRTKRLIIGGGDGSVSTAASLVLRLRPDVEIAVLPLGTANYYAKSLGLTKNLPAAFETAFKGKTEKRHLCRANNREFLIGVNIGVTSKMFDELTDEEKSRVGRLAYFRGILRVIMSVQPPDIQIEVDGQLTPCASTELVVVNQDVKEFIKLVPEVQATEPYFEIVTYGLGKNKLSPLFAVLMFAVTFGKNQKYLKRIKATKATIYTGKPQPVSIDGDVLATTPVEIELIQEPITFVRTISK